MKRSFGLLAVASLCALTLTVMVGPATADFVNGGFENGSFSGWTQGGGTWDINTVYPTGDPGKSGIVVAGTDPNTNNQLNMVFNGNYAARINNEDNNFHYSTLTQQITNWDQQSIYFAWAAVLDEPTNQVHPDDEAPKFSLDLTDVTTGTTLYHQAFSVYDAPGGAGIWHTGATATVGSSGVWRYTDWVVAQLDTSAYIGHTFDMTVSAYDCAQGGHGGYAYVDAFGPVPQDQNGVPEPCTLLLCTLGIAGYGGKVWKRRKASQAAA